MGAYFGEGRRTEGEWKGEGMKEKGRREEKEGEGKVFAGPMSNYAPVSDCMGRPIRPVGTVIFDTNNHEAN